MTFLAIYAQFYPALRRLLRLGVAVAVYNGMSGRVHPNDAFTTADQFLTEFDKAA